MAGYDPDHRSDRAAPPSPLGRGRIHALDGLRGWMMMAGLVLHSAAAYMATPMGKLWPFKDPHPNLGFDILVLFIHTFRVPVFFVIAGFFAALLLAQRGPLPMLGNRLRRIFLPLVVFWPWLFLATAAGLAFAVMGGRAADIVPALRYVASPDVLPHVQLIHLWFLFDLLIYYAVGLSFRPVGRFLPETFKRRGLALFARIALSPIAPAVLAVATLPALLPMKSGLLETPGTFLRPPATLAAGGIFFAFGWALYHSQGVIPGFMKRAWTHAALGTAAFLAQAYFLSRLGGGEPGFRVPAVAACALSTWLLVYAMMGLFLRYRSSPSRLGRYLADAAYWCYLAHLPIVAWLAGALGRLTWPAWTKFPVVLSVVVLICLLTYDVFVRSTWVGGLLNGRRYPRGLPPAPGATPAPINVPALE